MHILKDICNNLEYQLEDVVCTTSRRLTLWKIMPMKDILEAMKVVTAATWTMDTPTEGEDAIPWADIVTEKKM